MKNQKGITLVALVITIIVLLILAGVSISLVIGNNGVLTQASNAVVTNDKATALQEVQMAAADASADYYADWPTNASTEKGPKYTADVFKNNCQGASEVEISTVPTNSTGTIYVKYTAKSNAIYYFTIDVSNGEVTEVAKETAEASGSGFSNATNKCINPST